MEIKQAKQGYLVDENCAINELLVASSGAPIGYFCTICAGVVPRDSVSKDGNWPQSSSSFQDLHITKEQAIALVKQLQYHISRAER